jgi:hypothetical protein
MSEVLKRPDPVAVMRQLKDFQRKTVDYAFDRLYGAEDSVNRFLVADEVGLGKTLVAKGVVARTVDRLWDSTRRIDIIYICSNSAIARQNINRLNITGAKDFSLASRITMLPVQLKDLAQRKLNFISFTPGTSFDLRSSLGMMHERALLHVLLEYAWDVQGAGPMNALQGTAGVDRFRGLIDGYRNAELESGIVESFKLALAATGVENVSTGCQDIRARFDDLCQRFGRAGDRRNRPVEDVQLQVSLVGELRDILATTCLKSLEPDLIILDEFQRFKHLLDDDSDESRLARDLFNYSDATSKARVLLLSATPYKMFTGVDEAGGEDHYADFLATLKFLQKDPVRTARCKEILKQYRAHLLRLDPESTTPLRALKEELESELRRVMVRTERLAATPDRDGMLHQVPSAALQITLQDAISYRGLGRLAHSLEQYDPVEYWKSSPYLLSFMEDYQFKGAVKDAALDSALAPEVAAVIHAHPTLGLPWAEIRAYGRIDPGNARMNWLMERVIESGAWRLLWIPPAHPWYQLVGPFADPKLQGFTKTLVFSSWNVVPKAITAMVSYAAEREMMTSGGASPENTPEARARFSPLLRFAREGGAPLLALVYPSFTLARLGAEVQRAVSADVPTLEQVLVAVEERLRPLLDQLPNEPVGREDEAWYWAAPALLDRLEVEDATTNWLEDPKLTRQWLGESTEEGDEGVSVFQEVHVPALHAHVIARGAALGPRPADLPRVLAQLALAGPASAALRGLANMSSDESGLRDSTLRVYAGQVAYAVRNYFNLPEVTALVRSGSDIPYWKLVLEYACAGGFGSVMEEYSHIMFDWLGVTDVPIAQAAEEVADGMVTALNLRAANPAVDRITVNDDRSGFSIEPQRMRTRFAARLGEEVSEGFKERTRVDSVRAAFNSPFWPFVLATTSVGQEGLDFHLYCHAIAHWNLPSNPVDLEQREGRIHRFKGHAVRKNVAQKHSQAARVPQGQDPWGAMFDQACSARAANANDLWPYWVYPTEGGARIERHVPLLPLSREEGAYPRLRESVAMYRMVFGQPRQQDLLDFLLAHLSPEEAQRQAEMLRLDLTPR